MNMIRTNEVVIGARFRKDFGDLGALAESIKAHGLLQPIGVTKDSRLVFGERRLRACVDILQWDRIPARVVDVESLLEAERDENEMRKEFTVSERVAIGKAIEEEITERRGRNNPGNCPELKGKETRQLAAEKAGFGNDRAYRRAKTVTEKGVPELVDAVDSGKVSVAAAAEVAELPKSQQKRVVAQERVQEVAAELREERKPKADPAPKAEKPSELDALKAENKQLRSDLAELASQQQSLQDDANLLEKLEGENDKLAAACAEVKRLTALVRVLEERNRGFQNEKNEAIRQAKMWQRKFEQAQKRAA